MALFRAKKRQPGYDSWRLRVNPQVIEYSRAVLDEILETISTAQAAVPQGGLEVGGLLFGTGDKHLVRILASRPIVCEHAYGPQFLLSERDHENLLAQFADTGNDPELRDLVPVGWYVSRVRGEISLRESDRQTHSRHFPEVWHIALVFRQNAAGETSAGLFARGKDVMLPTEPMRLTEDLGGGASRVAAEEMEREEEPEQAQPQDVAPPRQDPEPLPFQFSAETTAGPTAPRSRRVIWVGATLALLVAAAWAVTSLVGTGGMGGASEGAVAYWQRVKDYWTAPPSSESGAPLALQLGVVGEQLAIRWRGDAAVLQQAARATLVVRDGEQTLSLPLEGEDLFLGSITYEPQTSDVVVSLRAAVAGGAEIVETARLAGRPRAALAMEAGELGAEVERLRVALQVEEQQGESLMSALRSLESMVTAQPSPTASTEVRQTPPALVERSPRPPVVLEQRPAAVPNPAAPPTGQPPPASAVAEAGTLIWTGLLEPGGTLRIQSNRPSDGTLAGALPGTPVRVRAYPAEMASNGLTVLSDEARLTSQMVIEEAGPRNLGQRTTYRYDPQAAASLSVVDPPAAANGWNGIVVRAGDRPLSMIFIRWERVR